MLYKLEDVSKTYKLQGANFSADKRIVTAVDNVNCEIREHSVFGIVGESGSGKSTLVRLIVGAERPSNGSILFNNYFHVDSENKKKIAEYQSRVKMIFQDPARSLNHRMTVGTLLLSCLWYSPVFNEECRLLGLETNRQKRTEAMDRIVFMLRKVGLGGEILTKYPTEFSGGQRQRIAIARALIHNPEVLICDEITAALDMSTRRSIIDLIMGLKEENNFTILFIAHDLSLVMYLCDDVMVMNNGKVAEQAATRTIFRKPQSKATKYLISALPKFPRSRTAPQSTVSRKKTSASPPSEKKTT